MYKSFFKRLLDILLSFIGAVVLLPVFLIVAIVIVADDPGPVFLNKNASERTKNFSGYINFAV